MPTFPHMRSHFIRSHPLQAVVKLGGLAIVFVASIGIPNATVMANTEDAPKCANQESSRVVCNGYKLCARLKSSDEAAKPVQVDWVLVNHLQQCPPDFEEFEIISDIEERGWVEKLLKTTNPAMAQLAAGLVIADPPPCPVLENVEDFNTHEGDTSPRCVDKGVKQVMSEPFKLFKRFCILFTKKRECELEAKAPQ